MNPMRHQSQLITDDSKIKEFFDEFHKQECQICLVPNCDNLSIKSHSVSKTLLQQICIENKVKFLPKEESRSDEQCVISPLKDISIEDAGTFWGFCKEHDCELFKSFENNQFSNKLSKLEQIILGFRSICYEIYAYKRDCAIRNNGYIGRLIKNNFKLKYESDNMDHATLNSLYELRDLYWNTFRSQNYSTINYIIKIINLQHRCLTSYLYFNKNCHYTVNSVSNFRYRHIVYITVPAKFINNYQNYIINNTKILYDNNSFYNPNIKYKKQKYLQNKIFFHDPKMIWSIDPVGEPINQLLMDVEDYEKLARLDKELVEVSNGSSGQ